MDDSTSFTKERLGDQGMHRLRFECQDFYL